ncbi:MAG: hypothetical protein HeimC3_06140 [Candidatus Heimdallarchaeota archaeon LC_3]|nr:MAG: hypothetical protein HeimC3_06140 [Candidatus Heimdallarchaeota archaeon LC_3]
MTKKNSNQENDKISVTLNDNRGQPIKLSYEGDKIKDFISAIGDLSKSLNIETDNSKEKLSQETWLPQKITSDQKQRDLFEDTIEIENLSKIEKMKLLIRSTYKYGWFSAKDIHSLYQEYLGDISSSTVSTYLARLFSDEVLNRRGSKRDLEYMLNSKELKKIPEYKFLRENNILQLKRVE